MMEGNQEGVKVFRVDWQGNFEAYVLCSILRGRNPQYFPVKKDEVKIKVTSDLDYGAMALFKLLDKYHIEKSGTLSYATSTNRIINEREDVFYSLILDSFGRPFSQYPIYFSFCITSKQFQNQANYVNLPVSLPEIKVILSTNTDRLDKYKSSKEVSG